MNNTGLVRCTSFRRMRAFFPELMHSKTIVQVEGFLCLFYADGLYSRQPKTGSQVNQMRNFPRTLTRAYVLEADARRCFATLALPRAALYLSIYEKDKETEEKNALPLV